MNAKLWYAFCFSAIFPDLVFGNYLKRSFEYALLPHMKVNVSPEQISVTEGETVELECSVAAARVPSVSWYRNGSKIKGPDPKDIDTLSHHDVTRIEAMIVKFKMRIKTVTWEDAGEYTCEARAEDRTHKGTSHIRVLKRSSWGVDMRPREIKLEPTYISMWTDTHMENGNIPVQLFCRANRNVTSKWYLVDKLTDQRTRVDENMENHWVLNNGDLVVTPGYQKPTLTSTTIYQCQVDDDGGMDSKNVVHMTLVD